MPQAKISHVVSFSSEDPNYPASNLLSNEIVNKKWLGNKDETSNSVVLQLEKSVQISQVHIGNYHSAFVEVLVGRSEANSQNYEVLVCANSFMSPSDSRNSENITRVKTFSGDQLGADVKNKKWDRIRIVCTQPYAKHVQFGLSFVQIFSTAESQTTSSKEFESSSQPIKLGRFNIRESLDDEDNTSFKPGELFARQKQGTLSTDAEIRKAGKLDPTSSKENSLLVKTNRPTKPHSDSKKTTGDELLSRKRDALMYEEEDEKEHDKIDKVMKRDREEKQKGNLSAKKDEQVRKNESHSDNQNKEKKINVTPQSKKLEVAKKTPKIDKEVSRNTNESRKNDSFNKKDNMKRRSSFENESLSTKKVCDTSRNTAGVQKEEDIIYGAQCLRGVVFVLSGYVNPKRSNLRDMAISLGARYMPDWAPHCTHLICAFRNTPKHEQVKKASPDAVIVTADWIEECGKEQAKIPWKWYALDPQQRVTRPPGPLPKQGKTDDSDSTKQSNNPTSSRDRIPSVSESEDDTDDEIERAMSRISEIKTDQKPSEKSESDTDIDEELLSKHKPENSSKPTPDPFSEDTPKKRQSKVNPYTGNTQPQIQNKRQSPINDSGVDENLPDYFQFLKFYVDLSLKHTKYDIREIQRYIVAYGGELLDTWPNKDADVVVTLEKFVANLRFTNDKRCTYLRPEWVWKCNDTETLHVFEDYKVA